MNSRKSGCGLRVASGACCCTRGYIKSVDIQSTGEFDYDDAKAQSASVKPVSYENAKAMQDAGNIAVDDKSVVPNAQSGPLAKGEWRALTTDEVKLAKSVFGDSIDYSDVRIYNKKFFPFQPKNVAMAPNGNIYFHPEGELYSDNFADTNLKGLFIHEMTHIWQHQQGVNVAMRAMFNRTYEYTLTPGKPLTSYGIEQQGDFVRDYYRLQHDSAGGPLIELYKQAIPFAQ